MSDLIKRLRDQQTKFMTPILGEAADALAELGATNNLKHAALHVAKERIAELEGALDSFLDAINPTPPEQERKDK